MTTTSQSNADSLDLHVAAFIAVFCKSSLSEDSSDFVGTLLSTLMSPELSSIERKEYFIRACDTYYHLSALDGTLAPKGLSVPLPSSLSEWIHSSDTMKSGRSVTKTKGCKTFGGGSS